MSFCIPLWVYCHNVPSPTPLEVSHKIPKHKNDSFTLFHCKQRFTSFKRSTSAHPTLPKQAPQAQEPKNLWCVKIKKFHYLLQIHLAGLVVTLANSLSC